MVNHHPISYSLQNAPLFSLILPFQIDIRLRKYILHRRVGLHLFERPATMQMKRKGLTLLRCDNNNNNKNYNKSNNNNTFYL